MSKLSCVRGLAAAALGIGLAGPASAVVLFEPSIPNVVDFGEVEIGTTKTIQWSVSWTSDVTGTTWGSPIEQNGNGPFKATLSSDGCRSPALDCTYDLSFTPEAPGLFERGRIGVLIVREQDEGDNYFTSAYSIETQGTGVAPIPLPAGLVLVMSAIGMLGVVRRFGSAAA